MLLVLRERSPDVSNWNLVIAGGGPAGLCLAGHASSLGARVLVLEKSREIGGDRGWIVDVQPHEIAETGAPEPEPTVLWEESGVEVMLSPSGKHEIAFPPISQQRIRYDLYVQQLSRWALGLGADIRTGCTVISPVVEDDKVTGVRVRQGEREENISSDMAADCTGLAGVLRKGTPSSWGLAGKVESSDIILATSEVREVDGNLAEIALEKGHLRDGVRLNYLGVTGGFSVESFYLDLERGVIEILIGIRLDSSLPTPRQRLETIIEKWPFIGERVFGGSNPIPTGRTWNTLVGNGFLVLGDSACQVIPTSGSGVASALLAGKLASEAISRALDKGKYGRSDLWSYCSSYQRGRGALLAYYYPVKRYANRLSSGDVEKMLSRGIIDTEDLYQGRIARPYRPEPSKLIRKAVKGLPIFPLLAGFAVAGIRGQRLMKHYRDYPLSYSPLSFESWAQGLPSRHR